MKLVNHDLKEEVLKRRNLLRQIPEYRGVFVDENLTKQRRKLFNMVRREVGKDCCYTNDGTIYARLYKNGIASREFVLKSINTEKDFNSIFAKSTSRK